MLPVHIKNILTILSLSFDTEKRNWRGKSDAFCQFVQFVTQQEFEEFKDEIKRSLHRRLRRKFTTAQIQTSPAPNIGQYVANAIRNIIRRY